MSKKVSDRLIETLSHAGIRRIYAVTGDSLNEVNDAVRRNGKIQWVHVRHEEVGAYAASAEAQLEGIACCAGSSGPGHVHLVNGLYDAHRSNAPVFAIASMCATHEFGTGYFQETDTIKLFSDCSAYNQVAATPVQCARMTQAALQHAIHLGDVAVLGLPGDVAGSKAEESPTAEFALPGESVYRPSDNEVSKLAKLLNTAGSITIYCGVGCKDAHDQIIELAEKLKAPVAYTFRSKMDVQYDNPYEIGMSGLLGLPAAYRTMHHSDLVLLLGTDFPYETFMPTDCMIVQLDKRPERIGRRAKVDIALAGTVKDTLEAVLPFLESKTGDGFLKEQLSHYSHVMKIARENGTKRGRKGKIAPEYVAMTVDSLADRDAIFTVDTGMCCVWGARYLNATREREMLGSFSHGSMANAMPMAIGAALARPDQQVIAFCGDGGLSMLLGDLATIVQYKLPVKLIVFNNRSLGMVKLEMEVAGLPDWQTDMYNPDFAAVAESMGIKGFSVDDPELVEDSIAAALKIKGPALVSVQTDPEALAMPPKVTFAEMKGYATAMSKLILGGRTGEVVQTVKANMKHVKEII